MARTETYTIIKGGRLVDPVTRTVDRRDVLIAGDIIEEIGPPGMASPEGARVLEAQDFLMLPGLVNAHTHTHHALAKGRGDTWSLDILLVANPWIAGGLTLEDKKLCGQLNAAEMVLKGCTAAYDLFFELPLPTREGIEAVGAGYADVGVKLVLAPMMADVTYYKAVPGLIDAFEEPLRSELSALAAAPHLEQLAACATLFRAWPHDRSRVRPALGPTIPLHCSDEFLTGCRDLAEEFDIGLQTHLAEAKFQAIAGQKRYGGTLAAHLDRLGLIGPRFTGAHGVWLDQADIDLLADKGAAVAHNPGSNLRLGSGIAPARALLDAGVTLGIGTDGSGCSDTQNMFEAMRAASHVARILEPDTDRWLKVWEILHAATVGAAQILGFEQRIGRIAEQYQADIVFLDTRHINYVPLNDAANQLVNCEDSGGVTHVMINGNMVLENRAFTAFDYSKLRKRAQSAADRVAHDNEQARRQMEILAPVVARHCAGLASERFHVHRRIEGGF